MKENEALKLMESLQISHDCEMVKTLDFKATVIKALEDLQQYRAIGTIEECRNAVERMKPKKVEIKPWSPARCPACGYTLSESQGDGYYSHPTFLGRCPIEDCGQRLDWSE